MFMLGLGLLGSIFLSFGCLVAAIKSLMSLARESFNQEARTMAVLGFIVGLIASAFFGWTTIIILNALDSMQQQMIG